MSETSEAFKWLIAHGYKQWNDGVWNYKGEEVDLECVLQEFIDSQKTA